MFEDFFKSCHDFFIDFTSCDYPFRYDENGDCVYIESDHITDYKEGEVTEFCPCGEYEFWDTMYHYEWLCACPENPYWFGIVLCTFICGYGLYRYFND